MVTLTYPFQEAAVRALKAGDAVSVNGLVRTGRDRFHKASHVGVAQLRLRLAFELRLRQFDGDDGGQAFADIFAGEGLVVILHQLGLLCVVVHRAGEGRLEADEVRAAFESTCRPSAARRPSPHTRLNAWRTSTSSRSSGPPRRVGSSRWRISAAWWRWTATARRSSRGSRLNPAGGLKH